MKPTNLKPSSLMADRISLDDAGLKGYLRRWARKSIRVPTRIQIILDGVGGKGKIYTSGTAVVANISFTGALLREIKLRKRSLPAEKFKIRLDFDMKEYKGIGAVAQPVHFGRGKRFELGVEFVDLWVG